MSNEIHDGNRHERQAAEVEGRKRGTQLSRCGDDLRETGCLGCDKRVEQRAKRADDDEGHEHREGVLDRVEVLVTVNPFRDVEKLVLETLAKCHESLLSLYVYGFNTMMG